MPHALFLIVWLHSGVLSTIQVSKEATTIPFWEDVYGFDMSHIGKAVHEDALTTGIVCEGAFYWEVLFGSLFSVFRAKANSQLLQQVIISL
jgi:hypothetical protein